jgi:nicotinamidase/pyrazinamidase
MKLGLFVIDPQNDFCDPSVPLYAPGADKDMDRLSSMIVRLGNKIRNYYVTMDCHHNFDIAHPLFWVDKDLNNPPVYTTIDAQSVMNGTWRASNHAYQKWAEEYVQGLEKLGQMQLCIWPPHCLIGSWGNNIYPNLYKVLSNLEVGPQKAFIQYLTKGSNFKTEHYSIFEAEYPDPMDPSTSFNSGYADAINSCDKVLIAGEARTHCVKNSLKSIIKHTNNEFIKKMIFLEDASSNVQIPAVVAETDQFFNDLVKQGMEVTTTDKFLA